LLSHRRNLDFVNGAPDNRRDFHVHPFHAAESGGTMASPTPPAATNLGVAPNVGGLLCYVPCCLGLVFSIVVAAVEKQSRFLRFHAFQSLLFNGALILIMVAVQVLNIVLAMLHLGIVSLLISLLMLLIGLALLAVTIMMMIKAYGNEEYELPIIGEMARKWA
jgi:uncharacterized membrane protein